MLIFFLLGMCNILLLLFFCYILELFCSMFPFLILGPLTKKQTDDLGDNEGAEDEGIFFLPPNQFAWQGTPENISFTFSWLLVSILKSFFLFIPFLIDVFCLLARFIFFSTFFSWFECCCLFIFMQTVSVYTKALLVFLTRIFDNLHPTSWIYFVKFFN